MPFQNADTTSGCEPGTATSWRADRLRCRATGKVPSARRAGARGHLVGGLVVSVAGVLGVIGRQRPGAGLGQHVVADGQLVDVTDRVVDTGAHLARRLVVL